MLINLRNALMSGKKAPPWDHRVAYMQIVSGIPKFEIPANYHWNAAIPEYYDGGVALDISRHTNASAVIAAPAGANTGDRKVLGGPQRFGMARYASKWRPAGIGAWPAQPTVQQIPFVADAPVKAFWSAPNICGMRGPNGEYFSSTYSPGAYSYDLPYTVGVWQEGNRQLYAGSRIYELSVEVVHPTYGFKWKFVPCIKNDTLYICDVYSGLLVGNTGSGTVSAGAQVPDDYNGYPY